MSRIGQYLVVLCVAAAIGLLSVLPGQATGGVFPNTPFNGMQITYSVSGAELDEPPTDVYDFTTSRSYTGRLTGSVLRVSGTVTQANGYGASVVVTVNAGGSQNSYQNSGSTPWSQAFDVSVPVPAGATTGSFSISMTGSYNAGTRGLVVRGNLDNNAPTRTPTATASPTATHTPTPTPTPAYDLTIDQVEVTQGVQCLDTALGDANCSDNWIPLVRGKFTSLRVYPKIQVISGAFPTQRVSALVEMLSPDSGSLSPRNGPVTLLADAPAQREQADASLNFRLPAEWTDHDSISLRIVLNPDHALTEQDYDNNIRNLDLTFNTRRSLTVLYLPIRYAPPGQAATEPTGAIAGAQRTMIRMFPVSYGGINYLRGATRTYPNAIGGNYGDFMKWLSLLYGLPQVLGVTHAPDQLVAWLPNGAANNAGCSDPPWDNPPGAGRVSFTQEWDDYSRWMAHEVAHNLGRRHPNLADSCDAQDPGTDWRYTTSEVQETGFDPFGNGGAGTLRPAASFDLMSYCAPAWVSPFTYWKLYSALAPTAAAAESAAAVEYAFVGGTINMNGTASLDPLIRLTGTGVVPAPAAGTGYCLVFRSATGVSLAQTCFDIDFLDNEYRSVNQESFLFTLPFPAGTQQVTLERSDVVLAQRAASAYAPTLTIQAPLAGENWSGTGTVRWTAQDLDGDALTYSLLYSQDNGSTWLPIDAGLSAMEYVMDMAEWPGATQARIRVIASDGFHTTVADAGPFTVPRKAPRPVILSPEDGATVPPNQPVLLSGAGDDLEDGGLNDSAFNWSSSLSGALGTGREVDVAGLPRGDHVITLLARDADGTTGSVSITLHVQPRGVYLPLIIRMDPPRPVVIFADDFEGNFPGVWQRFGNPGWGRTDCRAYSGAQSAWPATAGTGAVTPCTSFYPDNLNAWIVYGPFDLSNAASAEVTFRRWQSTEKNYDYFKWLASVNNSDFFGWQSSGSTGGWSATTFDLSNVYTLGDLRGRSQVWIAFIMQSDASGGAEGVFLDDVVVRKTVGTGLAASQSDSLPAGSSADLGPASDRR